MESSYREEKIYLENDQLFGAEAFDSIKAAISNNNAVGTIAGYYDEPLTIISVSDYMLNNLNYSYEQFVEFTKKSLKNLCCGNISWLEPERFCSIHGMGEGEMITSDGTPVSVRMYKKDTVDTAGNAIWILSVRVNWEQQNFKLVNEAIQSGPWYMDCDEDGKIESVFWSAEFRRMLGYHDTLDFPNELESWSYLLHPDDYERVISRLHGAIEDRSNELKYNVEYRLKMRDGSYQWFRAVGEVVRRQNGSARRIAGIFVNINNERQLVDDKNAMEHLIRGVIHVVDHFAICDLEKNEYRYYNLNLEQKYAPAGQYSKLIQKVAADFKLLEKKKTLAEVLSAENLRKELVAEDDICKFEYCSIDEAIFRISSLVPLEWKDGILSKFLWISIDVTREKKIEIESRKALNDAFLAAEYANKAKTEFLTNMSHDIRTPMNAIVGLTALAGANIDNQERLVGCLEKITKSSRHLLRLINEVLDMARIESGKIVLSDEEFTLSDLIDNLIYMIKPSIHAHGHQFSVNISHMEHEAVYGDSLRIQQVFTNLMSNAIKYTPDGGNIRLSIEEKPNGFSELGCFEFVIEDDGIGMSKEFQEIMFQPFTRADDHRTTNIQGTGLGMAIAQNIVHMMNGEIKVESEENGGTKVTVTIYLKLQEKKVVKIEELANLPVLVVDDEEVACESTVATLDKIGIAGEWVTSGEEAIQRTLERHKRREDYFAILMDWQMPGMDGVETTRQIRKFVGNEVTIIVLTAYDYSEIEELARAAGVDAFIEKPLFPSRLTAALKQIVSGQEKKDQSTIDSLTAMKEADYSGKRILLVEDNDLNREIAAEIIRMSKAEVDFAVNGKEAVEKVACSPADQYDLILMDIQMPVMNGYEATAAIRGLSDIRRHIPIIAITANAFAEDVQMAKNTGMNGHLAKPLDFYKLNQVLKKWLGNQ